jgi:hypothetical protein
MSYQNHTRVAQVGRFGCNDDKSPSCGVDGVQSGHRAFLHGNSKVKAPERGEKEEVGPMIVVK